MRKIKFFVKNLLLFSILLSANIQSAENTSSTKKNPTQPLISFELNEDKLIDIINRLAGIKQINILLPNDQADQTKLNDTTITFKLGYKITVSRAWDMMLTMLDIADFSLIFKGNNLCEIIKKTESGKSCAPLYINTKLELIKNNDATIRYLYYFQNINFTKESADTNKTNLAKIIGDMLQKDKPDENFLIDAEHKSLLITGKASTIKSIITIIQELDQGGFREAIEVIQILHTTAAEIKKIIDQLKPDKDSSPYSIYPYMGAEQKSNNPNTYFSASTRVIPLEQTNSIAIFGLYDSVQRVKDFIQKYLDKSVDSEKTVLHFKPLRYLDSDNFAKTLSDFVAKDPAKLQSGGQEDKILGRVIIKAEKVEISAKEKESDEKQRKLGEGTTDDMKLSDIGVQLSPAPGGEKGSGVFVGGNNLIIAASERDWKLLDKLIDKLDTPQWQVALEVLIVDMTIETVHALRSQLRRIAQDSQSHEFKWQSAQMAKPALDFTKASDTKTMSDINSVAGAEADLMSTQPGTDLTPAGDNYNIAEKQPAGTTIFTFKDKNGTAAILALLDSYSDVKILQRPFVITKNNQRANILNIQAKYVQGGVMPKTEGGTPVIKYEPIRAALRVSMTPRISRNADNINLEIKIDANDFIGTSDNITKRTVYTNANVNNQEVLVLGGIAKTSITDSVKGLPIISKIPFIGSLFKSQNMDYEQRNIVIFICPTRLQPIATAEELKGINAFTREKVRDLSNKFTDYSSKITCDCEKENENFHCLGDPITNFIFPYSGKGFADGIKRFANREGWRTGESEEKTEARKDVAQFEGTQKSSSDEKLKNIFKDETNPFKK